MSGHIYGERGHSYGSDQCRKHNENDRGAGLPTYLAMASGAVMIDSSKPVLRVDKNSRGLLYVSVYMCECVCVSVCTCRSSTLIKLDEHANRMPNT